VIQRTSLLELHDPEPEPEQFNYDKSLLTADDQAKLSQFDGDGKKKKGGGQCR
jgi:hypothetical protein